MFDFRLNKLKNIMDFKINPNPIYYKEGEIINNMDDYIYTYLLLDTPATYFKLNNFIQCRERRARTFNDLLWLLQSKFPKATEVDLAKILLDEKYIGKIGIIPCPDVNALTIYHKNNKRYGHTAEFNRIKTSLIVKHGPQWGDLEELVSQDKNFKLHKYYQFHSKNKVIYNLLSILNKYRKTSIPIQKVDKNKMVIEYDMLYEINKIERIDHMPRVIAQYLDNNRYKFIEESFKYIKTL